MQNAAVIENSGVLFVDKLQYIVWRTVQNPTQFFQSINRDGFVMFQIIYGLRTEPQLVNQGVCGYILFLHRMPQRFIANQYAHHLWLRDTHIILFQNCLEYTQKYVYNKAEKGVIANG